MEVFNSEILAKEQNFVDSQNPFSTCSTRNIARGICYSYVPTYLIRSIGMDFSDAFSECSKAGVNYKSSCIKGIGSEAIKRNIHNAHSAFALCRQAGSYVNQQACAAGIVSMYMNQTGSYSAGKRLCQNAPQKYQGVCNRTASSRKAFFDNN